MPRKPRLHVPEAVYHALLKGNGGQDVFFSEKNRHYFYKLLREGVERFGHRLHGFCQMTNHVHLAVQVGEIPLSKIMQNLAFRYTRKINREQNRKGHLFQGRYQAIMVDRDAYLPQLVRYIHLNPLRAGLVRDLETYPWSSHRAYLGLEELPWLTTDWIFSILSPGKNVKEARKKYRAFIDAGRDEGYRKEFHSGGPDDGRLLGKDTFVSRVLKKAGEKRRSNVTPDQILTHLCEIYGIQKENLLSGSRSHLLAEARGIAALIVRETPGLTMSALAEKLRVGLPALSMAAYRLEKRLPDDHQLYSRLQRMKTKITGGKL